MVATAIVGSALIGGAATAYGASQAADAQSDAANAANSRLQGQYNQTRDDLNPFRESGIYALQNLNERRNDLTAPIVMDQAALEQTPGYQFTKTQGLKAVQNSAAARGLGGSGAALKGAAEFTTGLANNTYKDQFNMANVNSTNAYNRLMGLVNVGQNAAAQTGTLGNQTVAQQANNTIGAGNAQAASYNAMGGAAANAANNIGGYYAYQGMYGNNPLTGG